jgi:hypothetical protein
VITTATNSTTSYITEYYSTTIVLVSTYNVTTTSDITVGSVNFHSFAHDVNWHWIKRPAISRSKWSIAYCKVDHDVLTRLTGSNHHNANINIRSTYHLYHNRNDQHVLSLHCIFDSRQWLYNYCHPLFANDCFIDFNLQYHSHSMYFGFIQNQYFCRAYKIYRFRRQLRQYLFLISPSPKLLRQLQSLIQTSLLMYQQPSKKLRLSLHHIHIQS